MQYHGTGDFEIEGRLVLYRAKGPFNYEGIHALRRDMDKVDITSDSKPWAVVCVLSGESLFTPDAESEHTILLKELKPRNLITVAYALEHHNARIVFEDQIRRIYRNTGVTLHLFAKEDEARQAVREDLENLRL